MGTTQLGYRIIAIAHQHPVIKRFGLAHRHQLIAAGGTGVSHEFMKPCFGEVDKFVEQNPTDAFFATAIPRKKRPFDDFGQIAQPKHRGFKVSHKWCQNGLFTGAKFAWLMCVRHRNLLCPCRCYKI